MKIILVPGLWLTASSWNDVVAALESDGHRTGAQTMPGVGEAATTSSEIGIEDWVNAVVSAIDTEAEPVVLVGHSGGGNVVWAAAGRRPAQVARVIFVDTVPPPPGSSISEFPLTDGVVPFPGWDYFPDEDVHDLDAATRSRTASLTRSVPARVPTDQIRLDDARHTVPVTMLMGALSREELEEQLDRSGPYGDEYRAIHDVTVAKIGSGHWPQFSQPERLAALISAASK